jgi:hypothetical protein
MGLELRDTLAMQNVHNQWWHLNWQLIAAPPRPVNNPSSGRERQTR